MLQMVSGDSLWCKGGGVAQQVLDHTTEAVLKLEASALREGSHSLWGRRVL